MVVCCLKKWSDCKKYTKSITVDAINRHVVGPWSDNVFIYRQYWSVWLASAVASQPPMLTRRWRYSFHTNPLFVLTLRHGSFALENVLVPQVSSSDVLNVLRRIATHHGLLLRSASRNPVQDLHVRRLLSRQDDVDNSTGHRVFDEVPIGIVPVG